MKNIDNQVSEWRELFPVVKHWTYLYNGSIHPCPRPVGDAMRAFIERCEAGGEAAWPGAFADFGRLRERFARLIHAKARNIVVTESTTAAINLAARLIGPKPGQNVVLNDLDFMTDSYPWLVCHPGVEVRFARSRDGRIRTEDLMAQVDNRTAAVGLCAVTVGSGFRFDLREVRSALGGGVPLLVDGAQALGLAAVDVNDAGIEFLAGTASKWLMGPTGVGFLYVADRYLDAAPPSVGWLSAANVGDWDVRRCRLQGDALRFQGGMPNLPGVVGALAGLELLQRIGRSTIERRVRELTGYLLAELEKIGVTLWTPRADRERAGIVFFRTHHPEALHAKLKAARIYCGNFLGGIRVDPNFYNTIEELDRFLGIVREHAARRRPLARRNRHLNP